MYNPGWGPMGLATMAAEVPTGTHPRTWDRVFAGILKPSLLTGRHPGPPLPFSRDA